MKECWRDGDLRAYLDGELSPAEMARVAAHMAECHECEARFDEVAGRAGLVSGLLESLAELEPRAIERKPQPLRRWRRWAVAGAAIAAGLAAAAMVIPRNPPPPESAAVSEPRNTPIPSRRASVPAGTTAAETRVVSPEAPPTAPARSTPRPPRRRQLPRDVFLALDDEPIETGVLVRMTLGDEQIPADVVFGKDGRARAIRLIGTQTIH